MLLLNKLILCVFAVVIVNGEDEKPESRTVRTTYGAVRGYRSPEGDLFAFYGIPYATAPTGPNKFKAPLPAPLSLHTFEAVDKTIICPQIEMPFTKGMKAQEDCLIANVFVPDTKETKLPVVVYIHGGAFYMGFGNMITPVNLVLTKRVIAVTINYRVGVQGFLCLGTRDAPGNAGLKDQVAALTWVKRNIANFGGNTDDITIAGYSAGSSSVTLLAISNLAKGLFNKVIAESGSVLGVTVVMDPLENAKTCAKILNFTDVDDVYALEEFYKSSPIEVFTKCAIEDRTDTSLLFGPCVERDTPEQVFLKDAPINILKEGKLEPVPMLYGFSNMEGLFRLPLFELWKNKMNANFAEFLPSDLKFNTEEQKQEVAMTVKKFYFGDKPVSEDNVLSYIDYFGDITFGYPMLRALDMYTQTGFDQVYLYEYEFVDEDTPVVPHTEVRGATHCSQTAAVLDGKDIHIKDEQNFTEEYKDMKKLMRSLWTNFIKTGNPTPPGSELPSWSAVGAGRSPHMLLTLPPRMRGELLPTRARFWDDIYSRYYRAPAPPPTPPPKHTEL
ncbi:esterase FE4-like [Pectinophora gossypiella]|uniref:esterase FE4-like n=1 Tax=Pectinophora gossypiella TaxID=13191 RepID=UPI00214E3C22|nr:esterase FE4-like [Pectinophora gossypiella]XP_049887142.1 esterase FE4-like [Pectinophora gossypiella]